MSFGTSFFFGPKDIDKEVGLGVENETKEMQQFRSPGLKRARVASRGRVVVSRFLIGRRPMVINCEPPGVEKGWNRPLGREVETQSLNRL